MFQGRAYLVVLFYGTGVRLGQLSSKNKITGACKKTNEKGRKTHASTDPISLDVAVCGHG